MMDRAQHEGVRVSDTAHGAAITGHPPDATHDSGHGDGHDTTPLGPIDWPAWGSALLGLVVALIIAGALYVAQHP